MTIQKQQDRIKLLDEQLSLPWYIQQFIEYKLFNLSPSSLLEYVRDYKIFLGWMMMEQITNATNIKEITLHDLEMLRMEQITAFRIYLTTYKEVTNTRLTVSRKLSALRSLFHYLSQIAEDDNFYPLLKRNIMAKIELQRIRKPKDNAAKLKGKLLEEDEIADFITYVRTRYAQDICNNKQATYAYIRNVIRDVAIISLILHSGLRINEVMNLNVEDIDMNNKIVYVYRKGQNEETFKTPVYYREPAQTYLQAYISCRSIRYVPQKQEKAFFLALQNGMNRGNRMTKRAMQQMIIKYAKRYGKPSLTVHKLRHSFATDYYLQNDIYKTKEQLGHASTETTEIYAHLTDKTMSEAIDRRLKQ